MNKQKTILKIFSISLGLFFVFASSARAEVIKTFDSHITVNKDASVSVVETIVYDSEGTSKHGIYRDITPKNAKGEVMKIQDISVADTSGAAYQWSQQRNNGDIRLKIGDPNTTFTGEKTYVVRYTATNAISFLNDYDEIYWNVTGNAWPFGIAKVHAQVTLPSGAEATQEACYTGFKGSTEKNCVENNGVFAASRTLVAGEGMTVAAGFPKGVIVSYVPTTKDKILDFIGLWWPVLIPIGTFVYMFSKWYRKGRDAKGRGMIVPEYEVIDGLTPLEAAVIISQSFNGRAIIAEILSLAVRGYISITQTEEKKFIGKKIDYTLMLTKAPDESLQSFDVALLNEIFQSDMGVGTSVLLSSNHSLYSLTGSLTKTMQTRLVGEGYYTKDFIERSIWDKVSPTGKQIKNATILLLLIVAFLNSPLLNYVYRFLDVSAHEFMLLFVQEMTPLVFIIGIIITVGIYTFFKGIMPAKTQKGVLAREHLLGLKEYIQVAEKDRIAFHNAPEAKPALFDALLPYAVLFGLEKKWMKAFEGITLPQPTWYSSSHGTFVPAVFISDFSNSFSSSFFSAPSSGSGGGGSSGGGGGGGGGGSW